jgi:hypothetical protein
VALALVCPAEASVDRDAYTMTAERIMNSFTLLHRCNGRDTPPAALSRSVPAHPTNIDPRAGAVLAILLALDQICSNRHYLV